MFNAYIKDTDSLFGTGETERQAIADAEENYLEKYPEEENNITNIEWDVQEEI